MKMIHLDIVIVLFTFLICGYAEDIHRRYEYKYCFKGPYLAQADNSVPFWQYSGNAIASPDRLRITPSLTSQKGQAWSKYLTNFQWWEAEIIFRISGKRTGADGLAVWFAANQGVEGPVFGSSDMWNGFGLFFDSFDNDNKRNNPYVMGMVNDGTKAFDHEKDGFEQKIGGCLRDFRNKPFPVRAKIEYFKNILTVYYHGGNTENEQDYEVCFRAENVFLPPAGYFGISGATGGLADDQDVFKFVVHSLKSLEDVAKIQETEEYLQYQKEFEEYERKSKLARDEYLQKHPEAAKKPEDQYLSPEQLSFNQLTDAIFKMNNDIRECLTKVDLVLGKQEMTLTLVSGGQVAVGGQGQPPVGSYSADETRTLGTLVNGQRDMLMDIRSLKSVAADIQGHTQQILSRAQGSVQQMGGVPAGGSYDMHITLKELNEGLNILKRDVTIMAQRGGPGGPPGGMPGGCPPLQCVTTWVIVMLMTVQLAVFIGFLMYRESKESRGKKFY